MFFPEEWTVSGQIPAPLFVLCHNHNRYLRALYKSRLSRPQSYRPTSTEATAVRRKTPFRRQKPRAGPDSQLRGGGSWPEPEKNGPGISESRGAGVQNNKEQMMQVLKHVKNMLLDMFNI